MNIFGGSSPAVIGMIHAGALPGTPQASQSIGQLIDVAIAEATVYREAGADALLVENMHDRPYLKGGVGPEIVAALTRLAAAVRECAALPCGVQVLAAANREALAIALAADLQFVRVEGFVYGHLADEGWIDGCAGDLLRYRKAIGAEQVRILADIKKKHSAHQVTADVSIAETAQAAAFHGADAVVLTGRFTGAGADPEELEAMRQVCPLPVFIGSGITEGTCQDFAGAAGFIVGSACKRGGLWSNPVDPERTAAIVAAARKMNRESRP